MKTIKLHLLAFALLVTGALVTFTGCGKNYDDELAQLTAQNSQLSKYLEQQLALLDGLLKAQDLVDQDLQDQIDDNGDAIAVNAEDIADLKDSIGNLRDDIAALQLRVAEDEQFVLDYFNNEIIPRYERLVGAVKRLYGWKNTVDLFMIAVGDQLEIFEALIAKVDSIADTMSLAWDSIYTFRDDLQAQIDAINTEMDNKADKRAVYLRLQKLRQDGMEALGLLDLKLSKKIDDTIANYIKPNFDNLLGFANHYGPIIDDNKSRLDEILATTLPGLQDQIDANLAEIIRLSAQVTADSLAILDLEGRMTTAEGDISDLQFEVQKAKDLFYTYRDDLINLFGTVMGYNDPITGDWVPGLVDRVGANETQIAAQQTWIENTTLAIWGDENDRVNNPGFIYQFQQWIIAIQADLQAQIDGLTDDVAELQAKLAFMLQQNFTITFWGKQPSVTVAVDGSVPAQTFNFLVSDDDAAAMIAANAATPGFLTLVAESVTKAPSATIFTVASASIVDGKLQVVTDAATLDPEKDYVLALKVAATDPTTSLTSSKTSNSFVLATTADALTLITVRRSGDNPPYNASLQFPADAADLLTLYGYNVANPTAYDWDGDGVTLGNAGTKTLQSGGILNFINFSGYAISSVNGDAALATSFKIDADNITLAGLYNVAESIFYTPLNLNAPGLGYIQAWFNSGSFAYGGSPIRLNCTNTTNDFTGSLFIFALPIQYANGTPYQVNGQQLVVYAPIYAHL